MRLALALLLVSSSALAQGYAPPPSKAVRVEPVMVDVDAIAAESCVDTAVTVHGVKAGYAILVTRNFEALEPQWTTDARVTNAATDEVTFRVCSGATGADPPEGEYLFTVVRR